jgi:hypothetical protein
MVWRIATMPMMKKIHSYQIRTWEVCGVFILVVAMIIKYTQRLATSEVIAPKFFAHIIEIKMDHAPIRKISFVSETIIARRIQGAMEYLIV